MQTRWRTVDIVVASIIAVAFAAVFYAWNNLWNALDGWALPWRALIYGVWLVPGVLGPLVIRKPGAGLYTEVVAASVSALFGSAWGLGVVLSGLVQGIGGEFGFAFTGYRGWRLGNALAAGALAGAGAALLDLNVYYGAFSLRDKWLYAAIVVVSGAVVAGAGSWSLQRSLSKTGVLDRFPSGRERVAV
ncbi:ECF transporter S component [Dactylosporangium sp. AC04546]|uniref:ECF transporter S component n=1 Tax=Dactylosporangium sp. AC04546 TaxID=2862460 RepID=UPI001EDDE034|nr:ECF transporter S component [Dactylosporangium sp. AC04546]WVK82543.1 ECF transporter S component [Dactylosporangium sp. AC04546]